MSGPVPNIQHPEFSHNMSSWQHKNRKDGTFDMPNLPVSKSLRDVCGVWRVACGVRRAGRGVDRA